MSNDLVTIQMSKDDANALFKYLKTWDKKTYHLMNFDSFFGRMQYNQFFENLNTQIRNHHDS